MTFPATRIRTYTSGMILIPDDLNEWQDAIIDGKHGQKTRHIPACAGVSFPAAPGIFGNGLWQPTTTGDGLMLPIAVTAGEMIVNVRAKFQCGAGDQFTVFLRRSTAKVGVAHSDTLIGGSGLSTAGHASVVEDVSWVAVNEPVRAHASYYLSIAVGALAGTPRCLGAEVDVVAL